MSTSGDDDPTTTTPTRLLPSDSRALVHKSAITLALKSAVKKFLQTSAGVDEKIDKSGRVTQERIDPIIEFVEFMPNVRIDAKTNSIAGYAAVVRDDVPIDLTQVPLVTTAMGTGRTWLAVTGVKEAGGEDALVREHSTDEGALASIADIRGMRVNVTEGRGQGRKREYHVVVEGNDRAAADELVRTMLATPMSLRDVVKSQPYKALMRRSAELRERIAHAVAERLHLNVVDENPPSDTTYQVVTTTKYARAARLASERDQNYCLVFSDAISLDTTPSGALVFRGSMAGYTWLRGPERKDPFSNGATRSWNNATAARKFSVFPSSTGLVVVGSGRTADEHARQTDELARIAGERVRSFGDINDANPHMFEAYHAMTDAVWQEQMSALGVNDTIEQLPLDSMLAVVPAVETKSMAMVDVAALLRESQSTKAVPMSRAVVLRAIADHWDKTDAAKSMTLSQVLAAEKNDVFLLDKAIILDLAQQYK